MRIQRVRFTLLIVFAAVAAAATVLEIRSRQKGTTPKDQAEPARLAVPYYAVVQDGELRIVNLADAGSTAESTPELNPYEDSAEDDDARPDNGTGQTTPPAGADGYNPYDPDGTAGPGDNYGEAEQARYEKVWEKWEKYEATFDLTWSFANPYDPDEIAVDALIKTPSGKIKTVPAFWYVPCVGKLVERTDPIEDPDEESSTVEQITQNGAGGWMLRYAPAEEGQYSYKLVARTPTASACSDERTFTVSGSRGPGFVRVSRQDPRYFEFDDGSFYFPIGQNVAWTNDLGSENFRYYMVTMKRFGANWSRIWMTHYFRGQTLEWTPHKGYLHGAGFYSAELAWKLDQMLEAAEQNGIYLMWCMQHHGQLRATRDPASWDRNPYNAANGGPLQKPEQFFTHPLARKLFRQRMRYCVARYGYSPHVFAWEFWNEVDLTDGLSRPAVTAWHKEMGDYVKTLDPTARLLTTSYVWRWGAEAYALPGQDFSQLHIYHGDLEELAYWTIRSIDEQMKMISEDSKLGKPVLIGEYGLGHKENYFRIDADTRWPVDPKGLHVHNSLWMGLFSGSAGTAMNWWWDKFIDANALHFHFEGISRYLAGEDLRPGGLKLTKLFDSFYRTPEVLAYTLAAPDRAYGWVFETAYTIKHFGPSDRPRERVKLRVEGLDDGEYWIEFWDTYDGVIVSRTKGEVENESISFAAPPFEGDIAFKLYRGAARGEVAADTPRHREMVQYLRKLARTFRPSSGL